MSSTNAKQIPKDAQVIIAMMKDMGILEYDQRVVIQLLEFIYRYTTNVIDDSRFYAAHALKKVIDVSDVKLAINVQKDCLSCEALPRDVLVELAKRRNSLPLPLLKPHDGIRLPPDRHCLTQTNFKLKTGAYSNQAKHKNKEISSYGNSNHVELTLSKAIEPSIKQMPNILTCDTPSPTNQSDDKMDFQNIEEEKPLSPAVMFDLTSSPKATTNTEHEYSTLMEVDTLDLDESL